MQAEHDLTLWIWCCLDYRVLYRSLCPAQLTRMVVTHNHAGGVASLACCSGALSLGRTNATAVQWTTCIVQDITVVSFHGAGVHLHVAI